MFRAQFLSGLKKIVQDTYQHRRQLMLWHFFMSSKALTDMKAIHSQLFTFEMPSYKTQLLNQMNNAVIGTVYETIQQSNRLKIVTFEQRYHFHPGNALGSPYRVFTLLSHVIPKLYTKQLHNMKLMLSCSFGKDRLINFITSLFDELTLFILRICFTLNRPI